MFISSQKQADFLKVYKKYCSTYEDSSEYLIEALREKAELARFMNSANEKARRRLTVPSNVFSFLIMPVQRLPRYVLLFQELVDKTSEDHPDYKNLKLAVVKAKEISSNVNQDVTTEEQKQRVMEIQKRFFVNEMWSVLGFQPKTIVAPHRRFIKEGVLLLENSQSGYHGKFYFYLFNDIVAPARILSRMQALRLLQELGDIIPLHTAWIVEDTENDKLYLWKTADKCCFGLLTPQGNYIFRCKTAEERVSWTDAIGDAISNYLSPRPECLDERSSEFPIFNPKIGRWRFAPLAVPSLSHQMAKHIYIRNSPPPCLTKQI